MLNLGSQRTLHVTLSVETTGGMARDNVSLFRCTCWRRLVNSFRLHNTGNWRLICDTTLIVYRWLLKSCVSLLGIIWQAWFNLNFRSLILLDKYLLPFVHRLIHSYLHSFPSFGGLNLVPGGWRHCFIFPEVCLLVFTLCYRLIWPTFQVCIYIYNRRMFCSHVTS